MKHKIIKNISILLFWFFTIIITSFWTYENPEDLTTINEFGDDWIIPYRNRLKPKTETFTGVVEVRMEF